MFVLPGCMGTAACLLPAASWLLLWRWAIPLDTGLVALLLPGLCEAAFLHRLHHMRKCLAQRQGITDLDVNRYHRLPAYPAHPHCTAIATHLYGWQKLVLQE